MKKSFLILLLMIFFIASNIFAQQANQHHAANRTLLVYYVDGETDTAQALSSLDFIEQHSIKSLKILKGDAALRYGEKGKNGVMLMALVPGTEVLNYSRLLDQYHIEDKDKKLPVRVDGTAVTLTDGVIFTLSEITGVTVNKKDTGANYINIATKNKNIHNIRGVSLIR